MGVGHYENFPVASVLCPPELRAPIRAIYTFARTADDIADEGTAAPAERLTALARYRQALEGAAKGHPIAANGPWPEVFVPLARELHVHRLPVPLLADLLSAFEQDVHNPAYPTRAALLDYCRRSANPVGRLLLHLYGIDDAESLQASDAICTALQLINFWQDLSVDLPRGRIYLPQEDCERHAVGPAQLTDPGHDAASCALVAELVQWAALTMLQGVALPRRVPGRAGWELRLVVHGGWRILEKIARMQFRSFIQRPRLASVDLALLFWRSLHFSERQFIARSLA